MLSAAENERLTTTEPGTPMGELMRRYWYPIAATAELSEDPVREIRLLGEDLVLYRDLSGELGLIDRHCPHRRMGMWYGIPEEGGFRCTYHGWKFNETGACVEQPFEETVRPESRFKDRVRIKAYPVQEMGGLIWAYMGPEPVPLLPAWDLLVDDTFVKKVTFQKLNCNWLQIMENSLDPVHVEFLHGHLSVYHLTREGKDVVRPTGNRPIIQRHLKIAFEQFERGIIKRRLVEGQSEDAGDWRVGHPVLFPNILKVGSLGHYNMQIRVPIDDRNTFHVTYTCRKREEGEPIQHTVPFDYPDLIDKKSGRIRVDSNANQAQDVAAWLTQGEIANRPLERLGESDRGIILYRQLLASQLELVERGEDPMNTFRPPFDNTRIAVVTEEEDRFRVAFPSAVGAVDPFRVPEVAVPVPQPAQV